MPKCFKNSSRHFLKCYQWFTINLSFNRCIPGTLCSLGEEDPPRDPLEPLPPFLRASIFIYLFHFHAVFPIWTPHNRIYIMYYFQLTFADYWLRTVDMGALMTEGWLNFKQGSKTSLLVARSTHSQALLWEMAFPDSQSFSEGSPGLSENRYQVQKIFPTSFSVCNLLVSWSSWCLLKYNWWIHNKTVSTICATGRAAASVSATQIPFCPLERCVFGKSPTWISTRYFDFLLHLKNVHVGSLIGHCKLSQVCR